MTEPTPTETPGLITVRIKSCCGALDGDLCECIQQVAELTRAMTQAMTSPLVFTAERGTYGWVRPASPDTALELPR